MGGGLMQLVSSGPQDIYLTGNPEITFFKVVYRRHTNFSIECIEQIIDGYISSDESTTTTTISRHGDLITNMHLDVKFPNYTTGITNGTYINWTNNTGHAYVKSVELTIGGKTIDTHYGHWMDIWNELSDHDKNEKILINKHSKKSEYLQNNRTITTSGVKTNTLPGLQVYIPLKFYFNRNPGLSLPLIALQYNEIKINLVTRALNKLINTNGTEGTIGVIPSPSCKLWVDYIYLDVDERKKFSQQTHEYLIEQLQYYKYEMNSKINLNYKHPVKEIIWVVQNKTVSKESHTLGTLDPVKNIQGTLENNNDYFNYSGGGSISELTEYINGEVSYEGFGKVSIMLNGHQRFVERNASYFRTIQPYNAGHNVPEKHIYSYSFAIKPEEHQPSGTCNFSRISESYMNFTTIQEGDIHIYAINYNILKITSGIGGLSYAN